VLPFIQQMQKRILTFGALLLIGGNVLADCYRVHCASSPAIFLRGIRISYAL
jgi:hypothetical protein